MEGRWSAKGRDVHHDQGRSRTRRIDPLVCLIKISTRWGHFGDDIVLVEVLHSSERKKSLRGSRNSPLVFSWESLGSLIKQPRRRRTQEGHDFAYLTIENSFARLARAFFRFVTFRRGSRSFHDVKWPVFQLCGRRGPMITNVQFCILPFEALAPI